MENCPKCNEKLNIDEKTSGRCFSCGATFSSTIPKDKSQQSMSYRNQNVNYYENSTAKIIKFIGIFIIIAGTIGSIILTNDTQSFSVFLIYEFACVVSGVLFVGFSEIIKLLEDIKERLKH